MDGHFNLCGTRRVPLKKDGKEYFLTVRKLKDYALKEAAVLSTVGNPYAGIDSIKDDGARAVAIKVAAELSSRPQIVTLQDEARFNTSLKGIAYNTWQSLSVAHPDEFPANVTLETGIQLGMDFMEWFAGDDPVQFQLLIDALEKSTEEDTLKNSDGQAAKETQDQ